MLRVILFQESYLRDIEELSSLRFGQAPTKQRPQLNDQNKIKKTHTLISSHITNTEFCDGAEYILALRLQITVFFLYRLHVRRLRNIIIISLYFLTLFEFK